MAALTAATQMRDNLVNSVRQLSMETIRLLPDSIVAASGIYALLTLSFPFAIFFGSMIEASLIHRLLAWALSYLSLSSPTTSSSSTFTKVCRSSFMSSADYTALSSLTASAPSGSFPSYPYFILTVASTYLFSSLNKLSKELESLGPAYSSRYYSSMIFLGLLSLVFFSFRLNYGCESFLVLLMTLVVGGIVGFLLVEQNTGLFGVQSMNLIGIPLLRNRTAAGQPIYICPK
jgi:hypothetical protein